MQRALHIGSQWGWALVFALVAAAGASQAAPVTPESPAPAKEVAGREEPALRPLVDQLNADTLQQRQQASEQLLAAGTRAIGPLVEALPQANAESTMRGLAILKKLMQSPSDETKRQARSALEQLSRSKQQSLATQAAAILQAEDPLARTSRSPGQVVVGRQGGFRMFQVQMMNGPATRRIVASENGRTVVIAESPEKGITVTVSERVGEKNQTTTVVAKSSAELDQKSPQAAALYHKYLAGGGLGLPGGNFPGGNPLVAPGIIFPPRPFRGLEKARPEAAEKP